MSTIALKNHSVWTSLRTAWETEDVAQQRLMFTSGFVVFMSVLLIFLHPIGFLGIMGAPMCTLWGLLTAASFTFVVHQNYTRAESVAFWRFVLFWLLGLSPLIFFEGTNIVNRARYAVYGKSLLYDNLFLSIDTLLFGWMWPKGQLSLFLDQNPVIGVTSFIGRCYTEVLQTLYVSYYIWGNGLLIFLAYLYFRRKNYVVAGADSLTSAQQWRRLQLALSAWVSTFLLNMLLNLLLPAVSPRIYIAELYKNDVRGLFLADIFRNAVTKAAANSFSAFPSGHCGLSWLCISIAAALGFRKYARITLIVGFLITIATITLRYHYIIDAIGAIVLLRFGKFIGFLESPEVFRAAVMQQPGVPLSTSSTSTSTSPSSTAAPVSSSGYTAVAQQSGSASDTDTPSIRMSKLRSNPSAPSDVPDV